ncbi:MAG TPA: NAD(P)-binding domain-containing protein [Phytomonospora sp.]
MSDILIIGGGQAGLATAQRLGARGRRPVVLDAAEQPGESWRRRWDSLRLFTTARRSALPGLPFPGPQGRYPGKDEVADYLTAYAGHFDLDVRHGTAVRRLRLRDGRFEAETDRGPHHADAVVVATGPFQKPYVPAVSAAFGPEVVQLHSAEYRNPAGLPSGPVLVVGGGNSGVQIAAELAATHDVTLAVGTRRPVMPQRVLGADAFDWLSALGIVRAPVTGRLGRLVKSRDPLIGQGPRHVRRRGVTLTGRFTPDSGIVPATVIWATGFAPDYGWIDVPGAVDAQGRPRHAFGVSPVPGLFHIGLSFQHSRGSALLGWVGLDAEAVAGRVVGAMAERGGTASRAARPAVR